jgi:CHAT domain-containing protein/tetratricopeptide (TPR) repeat protein
MRTRAELWRRSTLLTARTMSGKLRAQDDVTDSDAVDPDAIVSPESIVGSLLWALLEDWETREPARKIDENVAARSPAILTAVEMLIASPRLNEVRQAVTSRDDRALSVLVELERVLGDMCEAFLERCVRWRDEGQWSPLRHEAALTAELAAGAGRMYERAVALHLLASAHRRFDDTEATISAYEAAIEAGSEVGDPHLLAVSNDNLGNALADAGRLDEALARFEAALFFERDPAGRQTIMSNRANALVELGELRSAVNVYRDAIAEFERAGARGRQLAIALDNAADATVRLGEADEALAMLERARGLFSADDLADRAVNAMSRANVHGIRGNTQAERDAFVEAHDLAFEDARRRIDLVHYREGFRAAQSTRLPHDDEGRRLFIEGLLAKEQEAWGEALGYWKLARERALEHGDQAFALRIDANAAALMADAGSVEEALAVADQVRSEAAARGLALPELMALGTLGSLAAGGAESHHKLGPLGAYCASAVLLEVQAKVVSEAGLDPAELDVESFDTGAIANQLAKTAETHHADELALGYCRVAVARAREQGALFELANRLAGLRYLLVRRGDKEEAADVAKELDLLIEAGELPLRGEIVARRAVANHLSGRDRPAAIEHLRRACALVEQLRARLPAGKERGGVARHFPGLYRQLARLLREAGEDSLSFDALQGEKGRRLIDALAAGDGAGAAGSDLPATAGEIASLLDRIDDPGATALVDLAVEEDGVTAYVIRGDTVRTLRSSGDQSFVATTEHGDVREREARLVASCLDQPLLHDLVARVTDAVAGVKRLLVVPDLFLHNLPLHVTPLRGQPWCDAVPIGYLPAAGALRFAPMQRTWMGRSLVAGDSRGDLPYAAEECRVVADALGAQALIGPKCTRPAIEAALASEFDVVHLAVHGRADVRRGGRASLLLGDGAGGTGWFAFDDLAALPWRAELVVFSGCSTAVAGPRQGHELVAVARAAAEAGAAAVIACLWPVGDQAAAVFMEAFYGTLTDRRESGRVDLREALDDARAALRRWLAESSGEAGRLRNGRDLAPAQREAGAAMPSPEVTDALVWAPFVVLGDPVVGG